jgi:MFS family permease
VRFLITDPKSAVTKPSAVHVIGFLASGANNARLLLVPLFAAGMGAQPAEVGLLFAAQAVTQAILSIPLGLVADQVGRRRVVILALLAGFAGAALAATGSIPLLYVSQCFAGVSQAATSTVLLSALAASVPRERLGRAVAGQVMAQQLGLLLGPAAGAAVLSFAEPQTAFLIVAIPLLFALPLAVIGIDPHSRGRDATSLGQSLRELATSRALYAPALLTSLGTIMWGIQGAFLPLYALAVLKLSGAQIGLVLTLQGVTNVAARVPSGWLLDRVPADRRTYVAAGCVATYAAGLALIPHTSSFWQLVLVVALITPVLGTAYVALPTIFAHSSPPGRPGAIMGAYSLLIAVGIAIGPAVFGPVMSSSFDVGYSVAAGVCLAAALAAIAIHARVNGGLRDATTASVVIE